jgi:hypothetical protein
MFVTVGPVGACQKKEEKGGEEILILFLRVIVDVVLCVASAVVSVVDPCVSSSGTP